MNVGLRQRRRSLAVQPRRAAAFASTLTALVFACGHVQKDGQSQRNESGSGGSGGTTSPIPLPSTMPFPSIGGEPAAVAGGGGASSPVGDGGQPLSGGGGGEGPVCSSDPLVPVVTEISDFGMTWNDSWFLLGCKDAGGYVCQTSIPCPNQGALDFEHKGGRTLETFPIGGTPGQNYKVTFTFNALASAMEYQGGTRDQGAEVPVDVDHAQVDAFYRDGSAIPSGYEVWKLTVLDQAGDELRHYYMNSFPIGMGFTSAPESHRVFSLSYTKSIVVVGGGAVTHLTQDSNCNAIDNCGPGVVPNEGCPAPRLLPNEPNVLLPAMYQDPTDLQLKPTTELSVLNPTLAQPWHSQLGHLSITCVEETDDPVTHDYP